MDQDRLILLLKKAYFGCLTEKEAGELKVWKDEAKENEQMYGRIVSGKSLSEMMDLSEAFQLERVMEALQDKIHSKRRMQIVHFWLNAAVIIVLLLGSSISYYWVKHQTGELQPGMSMAEIHPGKARAILTLGNLQQIELGTTIEKFMDREGLFIGDSCVLDYSGVAGKIRNAQNDSEKVEYHVLNVPPGGEYQLVLSDGTKVWLNAASSLTFPVKFNGTEREVRLTGEAYFEVTPNAHQPFIVRTEEGIGIKVTGTQFNIKNYAEEQMVKTTLVEGCVEVNIKGHTRVLYPNEQVLWDKKSATMEVCKVDALEVSAWKRGLLIFNNTPLEEIMITLQRWYEVKIGYQQEKLKTFRFSGDLCKYDSFETVLKMFTDTGHLRFGWQGDTLIISER